VRFDTLNNVVVNQNVSALQAHHLMGRSPNDHLA